MNKKRAVIVTLLVMIAVVSAATTAVDAVRAGHEPAQSQPVELGAADPAAALPPQGPTDPAELEAFLDELMAKDMEEQHIAGAAVSVVRDGELFFAKGYGFADVENSIPVDPERTIFRIGSVGKLFTWTAVMQLVEQGKLDLDADVNTYLDFRIPDTYPAPITLKNLMTHTSGFEDRLLGSISADAGDILPVREFLISNVPARVFPPGEFIGYANFNAVLAGYIVARVSGQPYDQYIHEHIFDPLGMAHTTAELPMPPDLRPLASVGYTYEDGGFQVFPDYFGQPAGMPSGGQQATVTDMARFMIAHLQDGRYGDADIAEARILEEGTCRLMHSTAFTPDPRLLGGAYGFGEWSDNGQRTLGHSGYSPPMNSQLLLLPDLGLGIFVAYNTYDVGDLTTQHAGFQRAFFDHYFTTPEVAPIAPPADFAERAGRFVGRYRVISSPATTPIKVIELFGGYILEVRDPGDGTLVLSGGSPERRFVEVEPLYFREVDGPFGIVFREDDRGRITHFSTDVIPHYAAVKQSWYDMPGFHMALAATSVLAFLSMIAVAGISLLRNRRLSGNRGPAPRGARAARWIILGICVLNLLFLAGFVMWGRPPTELHPISWITKIVLGVGVVAATMTAGAMVYAVLAWKNSFWSTAFRAYYSLVTLAAVAFVWFLDYWNLLGWRY